MPRFKQQQEPEKASPPEQTTQRPESPTVHTTVAVQIPTRPVPPSCYFAQHVEVNRLTHSQRTALRSVSDALLFSHSRTANGKEVRCGADTIRWILEKVAEQMPK